MLRLLVISEKASDARELLARCRHVALQRGVDDVEIVLVMNEGAVAGRFARLAGPEIRLVTVPRATPIVDRLETGLLLRPLPDELIVVGRDPACSPADMCFLSLLLELRQDLAAITTDCQGPDAATGILRHGGAFRAGVLLSAGGFIGDGRRPLPVRPLPVRLASLGYDTVAMPVWGAPLEELAA